MTIKRTFRLVLLLTLGALAARHNLRKFQQQQQQQHLESIKNTARTPDEWERLYDCNLFIDQKLNETLNDNQGQGEEVSSKPDGELIERIQQQVPWSRRIWFSIMNECNRSPQGWRFKYIDEHHDNTFRPKVVDSSLDERYANVLYTVSLAGLFDLGFFKFNSGHLNQDRANEFRVAGGQVDAGQCARDIQEMAQQMDEFRALLERKRTRAANDTSRLDERHVRLAHVLDSFGRYESGLLLGKSRLLGNYAACTRSTLRRSSHLQADEIQMRYCWAKIQVEDSLSGSLVKRRRLEHETAEIELATGVCLPRSCHTHTLTSNEHTQLVQQFVDTQLVFPSSIYVNQTRRVKSVFCLADDDSQSAVMSTSGKLCLAFALLWTAACLLITYLKLGVAEKKSILRCFDLRESWHDFTSDKRQLSTTDRVELDVLNPIKVAGSIFIVGSHTTLLLGGSFATKLIETIATIEQGTLIIAALLSSVVVDTFYVISGLSITYIVSKKLSSGFGFGTTRKSMETTTTESNSFSQLINFIANWLVLALDRYLRIVPLFVLMWWFRRDVLPHLSSGPQWDFGFNRDTPQGACALDTWWTPLTPRSAFMPLHKQCYVPAWSVANDILFGLLGPPLLLLLQSKPRLAVSAMLALIGACLVLTLKYIINAEPELRWELMEIRLHGLVSLFSGLSYLYTWPIFRAPGYLIGIIAGYALFCYEANSSKRNWPDWFTGPTTYVSAGYLVARTILSLIAMPVRNLLYPYLRVFIGFQFSLDRTLWAAANAVLFVRMITDWRHSPRMRAFASQKWRSLARLNYAILFIHWIFVTLQFGMATSVPEFTYLQMWTVFASVFLLTLPSALAVHLIFENPTDKLMKRHLFKL